MTQSLEETEKLGAAGATAPRITLAYLKSQVAHAYFIDGESIASYAHHTNHVDQALPHHLEILTVCMLVLRNGFVLIGKSAPMSPENFDQAKGQTFAYEDALRQAWPLFAFSQLQNLADALRT